MTILGQHTISETRDLIRATDFRIAAIQAHLVKVKSRRTAPLTTEQRQLDQDMVTFLNRWTDVRNTENRKMVLTAIAAPLIPNDILAVESSFKAVDTAVRITNPRLGDIQNRLDREGLNMGLPSIDLSGMPQQNSPDVDFEAMKKIDKTVIDVGLPPPGKPTPVATKTGLIVLGAVGLFVGGVVVSKIYL